MKPLHACAWLQNKAYWCDSEPKADPEDYKTPFWCLKTHDAVGPDGKAVGQGRCSARGRPCYEPEVEL